MAERTDVCRCCRCARSCSFRASPRRSPPGRPGTLRAIEAALKGDRLVFAVAQRDNTDEPTPDILYSMGVIARIGQIQRGLGGVQLLLQGEQRATRSSTPTTKAISGRSCAGRGDEAAQRERPGVRRAAQGAARARRRARRAARPARGGRAPGARPASPSPAGSPTSSPATSSFTPPEKQGLLETLSVEERLRRVLVHVQRQIGMLEAQEEIKSQVQEELGERQREMYLREQMKAIQKELGDDDQSGDLQELREKLDKLELPEGGAPGSRARARPPRARSGASRWKRRSSARTSSGSPSCRGTRAPTTTSISPQAQTMLDEDHYGLPDVKDRVLEFLAVRQLRAQQLAEEVEQTGEMSVAS